MSVLSDERLRRIAGECGPVTWEGGEFLKAWAVAYGRAVADAAIAADREAAADHADGWVRTPINEDQAELMMLVGRKWLRDNAPHLLATPPAAPVVPHQELLRVILVEAIRTITGCPDIKGAGGKYLTDVALDLAKQYDSEKPAAPVVPNEEGKHCGDPDCVPCRDPAEPAAPVVPDGYAVVHAAELLAELRKILGVDGTVYQRVRAMLAAAPAPSQEPTP